MNYISVLTVLSAFAVVSLHTNGCFWEFSTDRYWFTANIIESVYYFAVPVFFMISGATLLDFTKRYDLKTYFQKRIHKTVIPFIVWSIVSWGLLVLSFIYTGKETYPMLLTANGIWNGIWDTRFQPIYWFFIPLFICYLSIPLLANVNEVKRKGLFFYLIIGAFALNSLIPFLLKVFQFDLSWPLRLDIVGGYLICIILGYWLNTNNFSVKIRYMMYLLAVMGLLMHIVGTYTLSISAGKIIDTYKGYLNVPCILYSIGLFLFMKELYSKNKIIEEKFGGVIRILNNYTFAVYLLHPFILRYAIPHMHINTHSIVYRLCGPIFIGALCIVFTYVVRKIPLGRHILP